MQLSSWSIRAALAASVMTFLSAGAVLAADAPAGDVNSEISALKTRIAELEKKENESWLTEERTNQIKSIVQEVIADSQTRGNFSDGVDAGTVLSTVGIGEAPAVLLPALCRPDGLSEVSAAQSGPPSEAAMAGPPALTR